MQFLQATLLLPVLRQIIDRCLQATETLLKYSPADARSNYVNTDVCGWILRFSPLVSPGADDGLTFGSGYMAACRELASFADFFDVYDRPRQYEAAGVSRSSREEIVSPKSAKGQECIQCYEGLCDNRGWTVKQFKTRDKERRHRLPARL